MRANKDRIKSVKDPLLLNSNQFLDFKNGTRDRKRVDALMIESGRAEVNEREVCRKELKTIGSCRLGHRCPFIHPVADRAGTVPQHLIHIHLPNSQFDVKQNDRYFIKRIKYESQRNGFIYRIVGPFTHPFWKDKAHTIPSLAEFDKKYSAHHKIEEAIKNIYLIGEAQYEFRSRAPSLMELVVVKMPDGESFKRGRVTRIIGNDCRILCVDTGEAVNVSIENVLMMHEDLLRFPAQARFCRMVPTLEPIVGKDENVSVLYTRDHAREIDKLTAYYQMIDAKKVELMDRFNYPIVEAYIYPFLPTSSRTLKGRILFREEEEEEEIEEDTSSQKVTHIDLSNISDPKRSSLNEEDENGDSDFSYHDPIASNGLTRGIRYVSEHPTTPTETTPTETGTNTS
ncbi:Oidioi.mRNA.OKI2018_I69.chr1.g3493.t1.cds [Oikopleura dioica]|uniref:Oidioi.mRNA.OKI2018_I69.chr1.g3493.t1.cds n=1 Tax=Oikopleura dioica TaxID=34765 RepID=A0ABN7SY88_OIKDI|nr:Oidioi.mRNA.OKI2018_I69.chr1.g3493.t1.cds [Oikopleura dioica]